MQPIPPQTKIALQSLRGSQPLVILVFLTIQHAMSIEDLEEVTGLHNDTVRAAVKGLKGKGLEMQRGAHGKQTWLLKRETFFGLFGADEIQSPKFSDSGPTTTTLINESSFIVSSSSSSSKGIQNPKFSDSEAQNPKTSDSGVYAANLAACKAVGIGEPVASELSALEHVTPELIHDHIADLGPGDTKGLAILRIRNNEPPASWERVSEAAQATQPRLWFSPDPEPEPTWEERIAIPQSALDRAKEGTCSECGVSGPCIVIRGEELCFDDYKQWRIETMGLEKFRPKAVVKGEEK